MFISAIVKPQLRKPFLDPNALCNYHPISNLSFLFKILEKFILDTPVVTHSGLVR